MLMEAIVEARQISQAQKYIRKLQKLPCRIVLDEIAAGFPLVANHFIYEGYKRSSAMIEREFNQRMKLMGLLGAKFVEDHEFEKDLDGRCFVLRIPVSNARALADLPNIIIE